MPTPHSTSHQDTTVPERVRALEISVGTIHDEISELKRTVTGGITELQTALSRSKETNWSLIFSSIALLGALYAAAIRPLSSDIERLEKRDEIIGTVLAAREDKINKNQNEIIVLQARVEALSYVLEMIKEEGSPITDKRLSIIEYKLGLASGSAVPVKRAKR